MRLDGRTTAAPVTRRAAAFACQRKHRAHVAVGYRSRRISAAKTLSTPASAVPRSRSWRSDREDSGSVMIAWSPTRSCVAGRLHPGSDRADRGARTLETGRHREGSRAARGEDRRREATGAPVAASRDRSRRPGVGQRRLLARERGLSTREPAICWAHQRVTTAPRRAFLDANASVVFDRGKGRTARRLVTLLAAGAAGGWPRWKLPRASTSADGRISFSCS